MMPTFRPHPDDDLTRRVLAAFVTRLSDHDQQLLYFELDKVRVARLRAAQSVRELNDELRGDDLVWATNSQLSSQWPS